MLALKIAVAAVTVLLAVSLIFLARGQKKIHGRINFVVFALTMATLLVFEGIIRIASPGMIRDYFEQTNKLAVLRIHLSFAIPSAVLLIVQFVTGLRRYRKVHAVTGILFLLFWIGTFITGIFFLPHHDLP
jgi:uncharacterized membrane protein YozB (DUF420 family)